MRCRAANKQTAVHALPRRPTPIPSRAAASYAHRPRSLARPEPPPPPPPPPPETHRGGGGAAAAASTRGTSGRGGGPGRCGRRRGSRRSCTSPSACRSSERLGSSRQKACRRPCDGGEKLGSTRTTRTTRTTRASRRDAGWDWPRAFRDRAGPTRSDPQARRGPVFFPRSGPGRRSGAPGPSQRRLRLRVAVSRGCSSRRLRVAGGRRPAVAGPGSSASCDGGDAVLQEAPGPARPGHRVHLGEWPVASGPTPCHLVGPARTGSAGSRGPWRCRARGPHKTLPGPGRRQGPPRPGGPADLDIPAAVGPTRRRACGAMLACVAVRGPRDRSTGRAAKSRGHGVGAQTDRGCRAG